MDNKNYWLDAWSAGCINAESVALDGVVGCAPMQGRVEEALPGKPEQPSGAAVLR